MATGSGERVAYFDCAASTPMLPEAVAAMLPHLAERAANPTGHHRPSRLARRAVDDARDTLAEVLGVEPAAITFCSGGTEADNLAVLGAQAARGGGAVVCSAVEHPAVLEPVAALGGRTVAVDRRGVIDLGQLAEVLDETGDVAVVSVMAVNNEVGTIQPLAEVAEVVRAHAPGAVVHTDAVQALPWTDLRPVAAVVDALSLSAHKFGGPQGVGALVARAGVAIAPRQLGGGQERGLRSGTPNVAGIVAMAVAARLTHERRAAEVERIAKLRDRLVDGLAASIDGLVETGVVDGDRAHKAAGNAHVCIDGVEAEALLFLLDDAGIAASAASACAAGADEPSHVLAALGVPRRLADGALRLSLGAGTTDADVDRVLDVLPTAVGRLRELGS
jgi:cysteine desulfurase